MEVLEINSDGSETRLDLASADSSLSLEGTVLKFAHKAVGAWSYAIRYSLQEFTSIAPVNHYFTVTTTSKCN
jgi:hypothetical protein